MIQPRGILLAGAALALAACGSEKAADTAPQRSEIVESTADAGEPDPRGGSERIEADDDEAAIKALPKGTPLSERVATLGLLNKRNNLTQDVELKPGEEAVIEDVRIRLSACEKTPPWETPPETGAFAQLDVKTPESSDRNPKWQRVFSGWLFKSSPSLNVVEHRFTTCG